MEEALELIEKNHNATVKNVAEITEDMAFCREQITTTEVSMCRRNILINLGLLMPCLTNALSRVEFIIMICIASVCLAFLTSFSSLCCPD